MRFVPFLVLGGFLCAACGSKDDGMSGTPSASSEDCEENGNCGEPRFCDGEGQCDDGIRCTVDSCDEEKRRCVSEAPDEDGDGHGDASCRDADGGRLGDDCDDNDGNRFPGNEEVCDDMGHDEDCDDSSFGRKDDDGDRFYDARCCNTATDGEAFCGRDCDDDNAVVHPGQIATCNNVDYNCNGLTCEPEGRQLIEGRIGTLGASNTLRAGDRQFELVGGSFSSHPQGCAEARCLWGGISP